MMFTFLLNDLSGGDLPGVENGVTEEGNEHYDGGNHENPARSRWSSMGRKRKSKGRKTKKKRKSKKGKRKKKHKSRR